MKHQCNLIVLAATLAAATTCHTLENEEGTLVELLEQLLKMGSTEVALLTDWSKDKGRKARTVADLAEKGAVPLVSFGLDWLARHQEGLPAEPCPVFGGLEEPGEGDEELHPVNVGISILPCIHHP